jgi:uncharacterized membrane protein YraQ (UPF0718 family)/copper chaperone CopZ
VNAIYDVGFVLWTTLCQMAPYLLFGFGVAGLLSVAVSQETVERHMGGRGFLPVLKAALIGVPLPLCSCGVIPVATSLRKHGAGKGSTIAFLLSTPQTGVDSIMVTYGMLGPVFAVFRPVVAFVTGLIGGWLTDVLDPDQRTDGISEKPSCTDECCAPKHNRHWLVRAIRYAFVVLPADIGKPLLLGLVISGVIGAFVPPDFFSGKLGHGIGAMFVMMLIGIPLYVCATASVPIAAALMMKGVSPGAALVFLITGPATNAAAIATIWKVLGRKTASIYLMTVAVTALGAGILLDGLFTVGGLSTGHMCHTMLPRWVEITSAIVLIAVLGYSLVASIGRKRAALIEEGATTLVLDIEGMTCNQCAEGVRRALEEHDGVVSARVDLKTGKAIVACRNHDVGGHLSALVAGLGFKVKAIT